MGGLHTFIPALFRGRKVIAEISTSMANVSLASNSSREDIFDQANRSVIRVVELLIERAHAARASDIHLDPRTNDVSMRYRIDGVLQDAYTVPISIHAEIISRIKILSGLRIDEHFSAQDGRFRLLVPGSLSIDVRVSVVPTYYGENAVLRLLSETAEEFSLSNLGFTSHNREIIMCALKRPYGMILATGPTGSGKTTSMYTLVKILNDRSVSIVTLEDPIEYSIAGIRQIQINPKTGLTFGSGLRSILRQDPNIIMVGEIRDEETAGLAVNTALTGHRLLSTLHTNDAATSIARLLDMGVEPYLIASTVSVIIGQRLVRRLCERCKETHPLSDAEIKSLSTLISLESLDANPGFFKAKGCDKCSGTGFYGRAGIHEVMEVNADVRSAILEKLPANKLQSVAVSTGMVPLATDGFRKAARGITSIEEILRIRYE